MSCPCSLLGLAKCQRNVKKNEQAPRKQVEKKKPVEKGNMGNLNVNRKHDHDMTNSPTLQPSPNSPYEVVCLLCNEDVRDPKANNGKQSPDGNKYEVPKMYNVPANDCKCPKERPNWKAPYELVCIGCIKKELHQRQKNKQKPTRADSRLNAIMLPPGTFGNSTTNMSYYEPPQRFQQYGPKPSHGNRFESPKHYRVPANDCKCTERDPNWYAPYELVCLECLEKEVEQNRKSPVTSSKMHAKMLPAGTFSTTNPSTSYFAPPPKFRQYGADSKKKSATIDSEIIL